jgi:NTE family protein
MVMMIMIIIMQSKVLSSPVLQNMARTQDINIAIDTAGAIQSFEENGKKRIAIACQGGGSHTAFTAGALKRILEEKNEKFEIVALSGTSGGAICALLAWYGLLAKGKDEGKKEAIRLLESFWRDMSASSFDQMFLNAGVVWTMRMQSLIPALTISPYFCDLYSPWWDWAQDTHDYLKGLLEKHVKFDKIGKLMNPSSPELIIGTVDVLSGESMVFRNEEISVDAILASGAIPTLSKAVEIGDKICWDGLYSQNPPIRNFVRGKYADDKPDEIWIIQINPKKRGNEPKSMADIEERSIELVGNLSLNQEVYFIKKVNEWMGAFSSEYKNKYKPIEVKTIEMRDELEENLDLASMMDRRPEFICNMMDYGYRQAEEQLLAKLA